MQADDEVLVRTDMSRRELARRGTQQTGTDERKRVMHAFVVCSGTKRNVDGYRDRGIERSLAECPR
jgi:hypothetical protein